MKGPVHTQYYQMETSYAVQPFAGAHNLSSQYTSQEISSRSHHKEHKRRHRDSKKKSRHQKQRETISQQSQSSTGKSPLLGNRELVDSRGKRLDDKVNELKEARDSLADLQSQAHALSVA